MCRNSIFSNVIHFVSTYLDFNRHAKRAKKHGMQRLVTVGLGNGNVILELARYRTIKVMYGAYYLVTGIDRIYDDAKSIHIIDIIE